MPRYQYDQRDPVVIDARAPMAQVKSGLTGGAGPTDNLTWGNMFKNFQTGETRSPQAAAALRSADPSSFTPGQQAQVASLTGNSPPTPGISHDILRTIVEGMNKLSPTPIGQPFSFASSMQLQPMPSLSQMASTPNHAQNWLGEAAQGQRNVGPYSDITKPMRTTYGQPDKKPFWASSR